MVSSFNLAAFQTEFPLFLLPDNNEIYSQNKCNFTGFKETGEKVILID